MRVVSNTSPISNLAIIGRHEFLHHRYGIVQIPGAVTDELAVLSHPAGKQRIESALSERWLVVEDLSNLSGLPLPFDLDPGETAASTLALQAKADVLLMVNGADGKPLASWDWSSPACSASWSTRSMSAGFPMCETKSVDSAKTPVSSWMQRSSSSSCRKSGNKPADASHARAWTDTSTARRRLPRGMLRDPSLSTRPTLTNQ